MSTERADTINRAIDLIDSADLADLAGYLTGTDVHAHLKADPAALRAVLAAASAPDASGGHRFGAWKAAQQILQAAGLPH